MIQITQKPLKRQLASMPGPLIETVRQHIAWSYANVARAHAAVEAGVESYGRTHHMIRSRLYKGLTTNTMKIRTLYDDEKVKFTFPQACCYCGATEKLSIDHLIPRMKGGEDYSDNLVWACKSCNSSKGGRDLLEWCQVKNSFPEVIWPQHLEPTQCDQERRHDHYRFGLHRRSSRLTDLGFIRRIE